MYIIGKFTEGIKALARHCLSKDFSNELNYFILITLKNTSNYKPIPKQKNYLVLN